MEENILKADESRIEQDWTNEVKTNESKGIDSKAVVSKIGETCPVNIPIQMMAVTDRDGKITPMWFRFEDEDHHVEKVSVEKTISRDECIKVGIREKRFICAVIMGDEHRLMELRYHIENHRWRIFQFLS